MQDPQEMPGMWEQADLLGGATDAEEPVEDVEPTTAPPLNVRYFAHFANAGQPGKARREEWTVQPNRAERRRAQRQYVHSIRVLMATGRAKALRNAELYAKRAAKRVKREAMEALAEAHGPSTAELVAEYERPFVEAVSAKRDQIAPAVAQMVRAAQRLA